jgi:type II secretory pathway predicted ATPase ExeA
MESRAKRAEDEARRRADEEGRYRNAIEQADHRIDSLSETLSQREAELAALRASLAEEVQKGDVSRSHLTDDFETLRGEVLRRLTDQVDLMSDGLHALRAGHTSIADEYVDRALRAITAEASRLRGIGRASE